MPARSATPRKTRTVVGRAPRAKRRVQSPPPRLRPRDVRRLAKRLRTSYGPQSWWPAGTELEMVVGALLVQNTAWTGARKALDNLIDADLLEPTALHAAPEPLIAELIRPSGYFNSKARKLKAFAELVVTEADGSLATLLAKPFDELRALLLATYGFGPETADSVCLYAARYPAFVIDSYTRRLLERLDWVTGTPSYDALCQAFVDALPAETEVYAEYHALVITHMKHTCTKRPRCGACDLIDICPTGQAELGLEPGTAVRRPGRRRATDPPLDWNA